MSEVHTRFKVPVSKRRPTRSAIACGEASPMVVTGRHGRGLTPTIPFSRISFATVLRETTCPASRRSAVTLGAPYTPPEAA